MVTAAQISAQAEDAAHDETCAAAPNAPVQPAPEALSEPPGAQHTASEQAAHPWRGENYTWWQAMSSMHPSVYACPRVSPVHAPSLDGDPRAVAWAHSPWSAPFQDIQGCHAPQQPRHQTQMKMLWDDDWLWVAAWMVEPQIVATLTEKNSVIYHDNDFEIFLDPDGDNHNYYEFEVNALNTMWELKLEKPYKDGGPCINPCNLAKTASSVCLDGQLNMPDMQSKGWGLVVRLPLDELGAGYNLTGHIPPVAGDVWRINFSRVQWRWAVSADGKFEKLPGPEDNWVWSPQGIIDMHRPEMWGYLQFLGQGDAIPADGTILPIPDLSHHARRAVMQVYHYQRDYHAYYKRFAITTQELGIAGDSKHVLDSGKDAVGSAGTVHHSVLGHNHTQTLSPVCIEVAPDGLDFQAACSVLVSGQILLTVCTRSDSLIWVTK